MAAVLSIMNLSKNFGRVAALTNFSYEVNAGDFVALLGPNGSGKTTTFGILAGVLHATTGEVRWPEATSRASFVLEKSPCYPWMTVGENLRLTCALRGIHDAEPEIRQRLTQLGAIQHLNTYTAHLSFGYKQRIALAQSLLDDPTVLLLDEPTKGLDLQTAAELRLVMRQLKDQGKTLIVATHILADIEALATHIVILKEGKLLEHGRCDVILEEAKAQGMNLEEYFLSKVKNP